MIAPDTFWLFVALGGYAVVAGGLIAAARADQHISRLLRSSESSWT